MKIVINDANILIDIDKLDLLDIFSELSFELYTTDFVYEELNEEHKSPVSILHNKKKLTIIKTTELIDFQAINNLLERSSGLSFEDCSVWHYAHKLSGILLTGDGRLRKKARSEGINVRGIIYIFDKLVKHNLLSFPEAISKIEQLHQLNSRLPKEEIEKRIMLWKKGNVGK